MTTTVNTTPATEITPEVLAKLRAEFQPYQGPDHAEGLGALNHSSYLGERALNVVPRLITEITRLRALVAG